MQNTFSQERIEEIHWKNSPFRDLDEESYAAEASTAAARADFKNWISTHGFKPNGTSEAGWFSSLINFAGTVYNKHFRQHDNAQEMAVFFANLMYDVSNADVPRRSPAQKLEEFTSSVMNSVNIVCG